MTWQQEIKKNGGGGERRKKKERTHFDLLTMCIARASSYSSCPSARLYNNNECAKMIAHPPAFRLATEIPPPPFVVVQPPGPPFVVVVVGRDFYFRKEVTPCPCLNDDDVVKTVR